MSSWIKTDTYTLASKNILGSEGNLRIMLSPYDIPHAIRAIEEATGLALELKYLPIEEDRKIHQSDMDGVSLEVGSKTGRIYKVLLNHEVFSGHDINPFIQEGSVNSAIDNFISHQENKGHQEYSATISAIETYANQQRA
jgi:hypothetical protein